MESVEGQDVEQEIKPPSGPVVGTKRKGDSSTRVLEQEEVLKPAVVGVDKKITIPMDDYIGVLLKGDRKEAFFCQAQGCTQTFETINHYTDHYMQHHLYTCGTCKKQLPGSHLLELHVLETHDTLFSLMAERKPMFACLAEECPLKFSSAKERFDHVHQDHKNHDMKGAFKHFECISTGKKSNKKHGKKSGKKDVKMEVECAAGSEKLGDDPAMSEEASMQVVEIREKKKANEVTEHHKTNKNKNNTTHPTNNAVHISFGHHGNRFQPWHQRKSGSEKTSTPSDLATDLQENSLNMDSVKESLDLAEVDQ